VIYFVTFFLVLSLVVSGLLIWYVRSLLSNYNFLVEQVEETQTSLFEYADHLKEVYEMETYYGDSTLEGLLKHTVAMEERIQNTLTVGRDIYNEKEEINE
tara:strand:- start:231 stop:530 length:300 start_codon:yes stop_codon:yes gene_type:complete